MVLQIVAFSVVGLRTAAIGEKGEPIIKAMDSLGSAVMPKSTNMIMWLAPLGVFSAISDSNSRKGLE
ncbi:MAG: cation:dicarboxylase symporter family transporter [Saprospiraceae bacterium]|nr:cation:dicarboxylase symporter family transporter [Saprospiraceae bacterium]